MPQRGRKSAAALTVIGPHGLETIRRPEPPSCLKDEEAAEWRKVVNVMPADYFPPETHPLLEARCCHIVQRRRFVQAIEVEMNSVEFDVNTYRNLCRSAKDESAAIATLSAALRLTHQSIYERQSDRKSAAKKAPWAATKD